MPAAPHGERPTGPAPPSAPAASPLARAVHLALAGVIGLAFVGFFVGIRQGTLAVIPVPPERLPPEPHPEAVPAMSYRQFDRRVHGPNQQWQSTLADLPQPDDDLFAPVDRSEEARLLVLAARAQRRAFDGAPPTVPHPVDQMSSASCAACHGDGRAIGKNVRAPQMSHPFLANCTQCHVEQQAAQLQPLLLAESTFEPLEKPTAGQRAWAGAPPTVPHPVWMRENCMSCHGPAGPEPIRTTHPYRASCLQCHAPSALLDQVARDDSFLPRFLPPEPGDDDERSP